MLRVSSQNLHDTYPKKGELIHDFEEVMSRANSEGGIPDGCHPQTSEAERRTPHFPPERKEERFTPENSPCYRRGVPTLVTSDPRYHTDESLMAQTDQERSFRDVILAAQRGDQNFARQFALCKNEMREDDTLEMEDLSPADAGETGKISHAR